MARPSTPEQHRAATERLRELGILREAMDRPAEPLNLDAAAVLTLPDRCLFDGHWYVVPPIPVHSGLRLVRLQTRLGAAVQAEESEATLRELQALAEQAATEFRALSRPTGWLRRLRWRLQPRYNPFLDMTAAELGALLAFFSARQASSRFSLSGAPQPLVHAV